MPTYCTSDVLKPPPDQPSPERPAPLPATQFLPPSKPSSFASKAEPTPTESAPRWNHGEPPFAGCECGKTVVRVARNEYVDLMEKVGVDVVLSARLLSASEVLAFARRGGVVSVSLLEGAKAEAVEVIMQEGAPAAGKPLMQAKLPRECLVCAYVRDGAAVIPNGESVLLPGDRVILFVQTQFAKNVMRCFKGKE